MTDRDRVRRCAERLAGAIGRRDTATIRGMLAPGFVHRTHGGRAADLDGFLAAIERIPGEIVDVRLERVEVDLTRRGALVTGVQVAQVRLDGNLVDDRRSFVDWFVEEAGEWRIQAAVDLPA